MKYGETKAEKEARLDKEMDAEADLQMRDSPRSDPRMSVGVKEAKEAKGAEPALIDPALGRILLYTLTAKDLHGGRHAGELRPALVSYVSPDVYLEGQEVAPGRTVKAGHGYSCTVFLNGIGSAAEGAGDGPATLWRHGLPILDTPAPGCLAWPAGAHPLKLGTA